jgi:hypothetical protein
MMTIDEMWEVYDGDWEPEKTLAYCVDKKTANYVAETLEARMPSASIRPPKKETDDKKNSNNVSAC